MRRYKSTPGTCKPDSRKPMCGSTAVTAAADTHRSVTDASRAVYQLLNCDFCLFPVYAELELVAALPASRFPLTSRFTSRLTS